MENNSQLEHIVPNPILRNFLKLFIPIAAIVLIGGIALFHAETGSELTKIRSSEEAAIQLGSKSIERIVQTVTNDLKFLTEQKAVSEAVSGTEEHFIDHLNQDWGAFSRTKGIYGQIRWIDNSGKEKIRVNYNKGNSEIVPDDQLQNKGSRYYFTDAIKLNKGEFFISPLDLNIEKGKIVQPLKPMIRIGTPIFSANTQKQGILLLNYLGKQMLNEYGRVMGKTSSRAWLINRDGFWMKGPSSKMEWGFMYNRDKTSMVHLYPDSWKKIILSTKGQFEDEHGLWTFDTVYPLVEGQKTSTGASYAFSPSRSNLKIQEYFWKSVLLLPAKQYNATISHTGIKLAVVIFILLFGLSYGSWRLAYAWAAEEKAKKELRKINLDLEHIVEERTKNLQIALDEVKTLQGIIPICSYCHSIRDDDGAWDRVDAYLSKHSDAMFSHGICPKCMVKARNEAGLDDE